MIEVKVDIRKAKSTKLVDFNEICRESDSVEGL
jgi:hypothetical protein